MTPEKDEIEKARFCFELALKSDRVVQQAYERLNEKIRAVFAVTSALIPIVVGLGYFILKETKDNWIFIPIVLSLFFLLLAIVQGVSLHKPTNFLFLEPKTFLDKFKDKPLRYIINKSAFTWAESVQHNHKVVMSKEKSLNRMLSFVAVSLGILAFSFFILGASTL